MGIFSVVVRRDGGIAVLIPASPDIDPELRRTLAAYGRTLVIDQPIPGCAHLASVYALAFDPDSGIIVGTDLGKPPGTGGPLHGRPLDDVPASATVTPAPDFVFIDGPRPSGGATMCPGERTQHFIIYPSRFTVPVGSAKAFIAQNGRHAGSIAGTIRADGGVAIAFPREEHIDFRLRDSIVVAARQIRLAEAIPDCTRLAGVFMGTFSVDDGSLELREVPLTMPILSASPSPTSN